MPPLPVAATAIDLDYAFQLWSGQATKCEEEAARSTKFIKEVEDWCSGEVEAIQATSTERLAKEQQQVAHW